MIDKAVAYVISRLVQNPDFEEKMKEKINMSIDTREADQSLEAAEKQLRQAIGVKDKLIAQLDNLDITDRAYDRKYNDLQERIENAYVKITELEDVVAQYQEEIESIRREKISADNVYNYLILFHDAYDQLPDIWKKKFFQSFIQEIQLYPEQQENGQVLKSMKFKFPVFYNGQTIEEIRWDKENTVETVVQLSKGNISSQNVRVEFSLEDMDMSRFQQGATYEQIQEWVQEKYGFHVTHLNIAKTKRKCGIIERENYNFPKSEDSQSPKTPKGKEEAIIDAFLHFKMM